MQNDLGYSQEEIKTIFKLYPEISLNSAEIMNSYVTNMREIFEMNDEEIKTILLSYPPAVEQDLFKLHKINNLLKESLFNEEKTSSCKEVIVNAPFILTFSFQKIHNYILYFLKEKFTGVQLTKIFWHYPLFLYGSIENLQMCFGYFKNLYLSSEDIAYICSSNPYTLSLDYRFIMIYKIKIFKEMGVERRELGQLFKKFPIITSKSLVSISRKINYLIANFTNKVRGEPYFPKILCYDFKKYIEPRGKRL